MQRSTFGFIVFMTAVSAMAQNAPDIDPPKGVALAPKVRIARTP